MTISTKTKNIPTLRFPGFLGEPDSANAKTGNWEEKKFGDFLISKIREINKPKDLYKAIGIRSHFKGTFQKPNSNPQKIAMEKLFLVKENDFIANITFAWEGALAIAKKEDEGGLVSHRFPTYIFNENITTSDYFRYVFPISRFKYLLGTISPGGAGRNRVLNKKDFLKLKVLLPGTKEQQKIASFLGTVDDLIENLRAQKESLVDYKKGMMQKIFSQEIRFKDDNGKNFSEWEEIRVGDIGKISTSSVDKKTNGNEKTVSLLNYMDVYRRDYIVQNDNFQTVSAKDSQIISSNLKKGDVLFTPSSETPDDIGHSAVVMEDLNDVLFSYHLVRFRPKKNILDYNFSAYAFKSFKFYKNLWRMAQGATRFTLSKDALESSKIELPKSLIEQQKIAEFLTSLDNLIESKQQQITQAEKWKKGLMQGLFV